MELGKAGAMAEELKNGLAGECHRIQIVGDIRRQKPRVRNIELLCVPGPVEGFRIPQDDPFWSRWVPTAQEWWLAEEEENNDAVHLWVMDMMHQKILDWTSAGSGRYSTTRKFVVHRPSGMTMQIVSTDEQCWPVALAVTTGGRKTIRRIAAAARQKGWQFRPSGDGFDTPGGHITCKTEEEVFKAVGLLYMPPEQRE